MGIKKIIEQLDEFFDLSKKKQRTKKDKLLKIISTLEQKKLELKESLQKRNINDRKSKKNYHLCKEYKVILKLLKKAKRKELSE